METRNIERAIKSPSRIVTAAKSLNSWFQNEYRILERACEIGRESLLTETDPEKRAETIRSIKQLQKERQELLNGFRNSSLRRKMKEQASKSEQPEIEKRSYFLQAPADMSRAEGTSTTRLTAKSIYGYAAKFNVLSEDLGGFYEKIEPGAFGDAIRTSDVRLLYNHDPNFVLSRSSAATLELSEDNVGLSFVGYLLPFDSMSYSLARRVDRKDISGCSFSFIVAKDRWILAKTPNDIDIRIIEKVKKLFDVGPVTYPAYPATSVQAVFEKVSVRSIPSEEESCDIKIMTDQELDDYEAEEYEQFCREYDEKHRPISDERQKQLIKRLNLLQDRINRNRASYLS